MIPSANIVPALGPPMFSIWIVTSTGKSNVGSRSTPISARPLPSSVVTTWTVCALPPRVMPSETVAPGSIASISVDSAEKLVTSVPSTEVMTSPFSSTPCAPLPCHHPADRQRRGHLVAELLQGRDGGVLLRGGHLGLALLGDLLLGLVRREERLDRHHGVGRRHPAAQHVGQRHRVAGPARGRHRGQPQLAGGRVGLRAADLDQGLAVVLAERVQRRAGCGDRVRQRQRDGDREQQRQRHRRHAQHDRPRGGGAAAPGRRRHRAAGGRTGRRRAGAG